MTTPSVADVVTTVLHAVDDLEPAGDPHRGITGGLGCLAHQDSGPSGGVAV